MAEQSEKTATGGTIDVKGLVLAALGAVLAAVVTGEFFPKGALVTTAVTPVIITLVREGLRRPADKLTATAARVTVAPARGASALAGAGTKRFKPDPDRFDQRRLLEAERGGAGRNGEGAVVAPPPPVDDTRAYDPGAGSDPDAGGAAPTGPADTPPAVAADRPAERTVYGRRRFRLKLALVTGLLAFGIAAAVLTASELAIGGSVTGGDRGTSLFGGERSAKQDDDRDGSSDEGSDDGSSDSGGSSSGSSGSSGSSSSGGSSSEDESVAPPESSEPAPTEEPAPAEPAPAEPAPTE